MKLSPIQALSGYAKLDGPGQATARRLVWYIVRAELVFGLLPYCAARRLVFRPKPVRSPANLDPAASLRSHLELLERITRRLPWEVTCLRQAVGLRDALAADGVEATLRLGLMRRETGMAAHAWVVCEGQEALKNGPFRSLNQARREGNRAE